MSANAQDISLIKGTSISKPYMEQIISRIIEDPQLSQIAAHSAAEDLWYTIDAKKSETTACIESFCHAFNINKNAFRDDKKICIQIRDNPELGEIIKRAFNETSNQEYSQTMRTIITFQSIHRYESMAAQLANEFAISNTDARKIIISCGHYLNKATENMNEQADQQPSPIQRSYLSSPLSFHSEDQRSRGISSESSEEIRRNGLAQNAEVRPATPGRTSP